MTFRESNMSIIPERGPNNQIGKPGAPRERNRKRLRIHTESEKSKPLSIRS